MFCFETLVVCGTIAGHIGSFLACDSLLWLAASNSCIKKSGLEYGLVSIRGCNFGTETLIHGFVSFVRKCPSILHVDMDYPCEAPDIVVTSIAENCKKLLSIELYSDLYGPVIPDAAIRAIAQSCEDLVYINIDDSDVTDDTAQLLATSCPKLEFVSIGGTRITEIGLVALAKQCTLAARASAKILPSHMRGPHLAVYRLDDHVDVATLERHFPEIRWLY